jgi:immune inhibitor A
VSNQPEDGVRKPLILLSSIALLLTLAVPASAVQPNGRGNNDEHAGKSDNLPGKLAQKQLKLKQTALDKVLKGEAKPKGPNKVVEVAKGQFVELALDGTDQILTLLGEFGDEEASHDHGSVLGVIDHNGTPGPLHNEIPEPDRAVDNTTIWVDDFSQDYFDNLLYNRDLVPSMANWYLKASDGRYTVDGQVSDWVQVPFNAAAYGSNYCGSIVCTRDIGRFLLDQGEAWYQAQLDAGMTAEEIDAFLAPFDVWDRYDYDGDGDFNEADGYIDHYQSVHAGEGEETGGGALGEDAIWSHRSYANSGFAGTGQGPTVINDEGDPEVVPFEGAPIGESSYWIGDYTIEPENGGVGVFAHEFGHDYNIPDLYDTSGNTGGAENSTAWWTTWSQGSYGTISDDLGTYPVHMAAWEKFFMGWLNYEVAVAGQRSAHKLSAISANTKQAQGVFVVLPPKEVTTFVGEPWSGDWFYHSGSGNDLDNTMTKSFTLPGAPVNLSFSTRYHIEPCWDYAQLRISTDNGATWVPVHTSASDDPALNVNGQNPGEGISGVSGHTLACDDNLDLEPSPVDVTADLGAYANQTVLLQFRYVTDGAAVGEGLGWDDLAINGTLVDDAETDTGWAFDGFVRTNGEVTSVANHYYLAEYRKYQGYDLALDLGPYNFVDPEEVTDLFNYVEHFPYQDGLLVWYWDTSQADNNVGDHPGEGLLLPIDAHPDILHWSDGSVARPRVQSYDSTFGLEATEEINLTNISPEGTDDDLTLTAPSLPGVRTFNDNQEHWVSGDPGDAPDDGRYQAEWSSVNHPHTGTTITVAGTSAQGNFMQIVVNK